MAQAEFSQPVQDSVAKVNREVAVGEDLDFQRSWWKFERFVWSFFLLLLVLDLAGLFGRGPLSHAHLEASDNSIAVEYEKIARAETPSILDISFGPSAIQDGKVRLFVSESIVKALGAQRLSPAPLATEIGNAGLTYIWPASAPPASVQFALQPSSPGIFHFTLQVPGAQPVTARVVVMP
jgi:hypothetical protein